MTAQVWDFTQARDACRSASLAQQNVEDSLREAYRDFAGAEERYRVALAKRILEVHDEQEVAWSVAGDVARGDANVAKLRRERDVAEGLKEAMVQAAWRRAADRRDAQRFSDYSLRRDLAENGGTDGRGEQPVWSEESAA